MKKGKIFLNEKNVSKIEILRRTKKNYTHHVNIDATIISVTTWRKSKLKFRINLITNILTFGILHIISLFKPKLYIKIYCKESLPSNSDFFLIEDIYQNFTLCKTIYCKSSKRRMSFPGNSQNNERIVYVNIFFIYNSMKYRYDNDMNAITPVFFNLSKYKNNNIVNFFSEGINSYDKYKNQIEKFGQNILDLHNKLLYENFIKKDLPECVSVFISGVICFFSGVSIFGILLVSLSIIVVLMKLIYRYVKFIKQLGHDYTIDGIMEYKVKRNYLKEKKINGYNMIKNIDLVPGDIICLCEGEILPCDGIILDGECIVNESKILGKINKSIKYPMEINNNFFNYEKNKNSILFHGAEILKIYSKNTYKKIVVLIINTGINTFKANLLTNLLNKKILDEYGETLYQKILKKYYIVFIIILYIASSIGIIVKYVYDGRKFPVHNHLILNFGIALMPIYYIIICSIKQLGILKLNNDNNGIQCIDESKLIESGKINRIIFDKTGTLTSNNIEISAFIPLYFDISSYKFYFKIYEKKNIKKICDEHLIHYRNYLLNKSLSNNSQNTQLNMQTEYKNSLLETFYDKNFVNYNSNYELSSLFLECLICCTNTAKINNEICGNIIEKEIIDIMKWDINTVEIMSENNSNSNCINPDKNENIIDKIHKFGSIFFKDAVNINNNYNYNSLNIINEVFPKNYYKITEGMKMSQKKNKKTKKKKKSNENFQNNIKKLISFKLIIITRFLGRSFMSISCIVYNYLEENYRFMIKGPPEKILKHCINNSLPDIETLLTKCLREGYRVIACATKIIQYNENDRNQNEEYFLKDLIFCGFILLKNNLKEESKQIIENLRKMECDIVISTGDGVFNAIGTGLKTELFSSKNIYAFDLNMKGKKSKILVTTVSLNKNDQENESEKDIKTEEDNSREKKKHNENYSSDNNSKSNNYMKKKSLNKLKFPNHNNNTFINDGPSSSRQMIYNNEVSFNKYDINKREEIDSSVDSSRLDEVNNSPYSNYDNEDENVLSNNKKRSFKYSSSSIVNGIEHSQKSLKNSLSNGKKESPIKQVTSKKKNANHGNNVMPYDEFHLDLYMHYQNLSPNILNKKKNSNIKKNFFSSSKINNNNTLEKVHSKNKSLTSKREIFFNELNNYKNDYLNQNIYFEFTVDKLKYFKDECTLCFSGLVLKYIYEQRKNKEIKILLKLMLKFGKIFFSMSSNEKALLIKINKEIFNKKVCMVGDGHNDIEAILNSNVGIFIGKRININTLLSHYLIENNSLMNIETIIKNGRGYYENDNILLPVNFTFTSCYVGLITYSYYLEKKVDNAMLTFLNLSIFILCVTAFSINPEYKINFSYLASNEKLLKVFKMIRFFGIFLIKIICQIIFYFMYDYNENIDMSINKDIILTYIFIMTWSQAMSSVLVFNINTFYRKSFLSNFIFLIVYIIFFLFIIYLITLNDISLGKIEVLNVSFEFYKNNVDFFDDTHKLLLLYIILGDIFLPSILVIILKYVFEKKAINYRQKKMNEKQKK